MSLKRASLLLLITLLTACNIGSSHRSLNSAGEQVEIGPHLASGKMNIVYFYADW